METLERATTQKVLAGFTAVLLTLWLWLMYRNEAASVHQSLLIASVAFGSLTLLHRWFGWKYLSVATVLCVDALAAWYLPTDEQYIVVAVPAVVALLLTNTRWLVLSAVYVYGVLLLRSNFSGPYVQIGTLAAYCLIIGGLYVGRQNFDAARMLAEASKNLLALQTAMKRLISYADDKLTAALGYLDLFATSTPVIVEDQELAGAQQELEQLAMQLRNLQDHQQLS